jgi:hypothetical protein
MARAIRLMLALVLAMPGASRSVTAGQAPPAEAEDYPDYSDPLGSLYDYTVGFSNTSTIPTMTTPELEREFGPLIQDEAGAKARFEACKARFGELRKIVNDVEKNFAAARTINAQIPQAVDDAQKATAALKAGLLEWQLAFKLDENNKEAERLRTEVLPGLRQKYEKSIAKLKNLKSDAEAQDTSNTQNIAALRQRTAEFVGTQVTAGEIAGKGAIELSEEMFRYCLRIREWALRRPVSADALPSGRPNADTSREGPPDSTETIPLTPPRGADTTNEGPPPQDEAVPGESAVDRPPANTASEGPPEEPRTDAPSATSETILRISGGVDWKMVEDINKKAEVYKGGAAIDGGQITLSFIAEKSAPDGVRTGRVEVSPNTVKHTNVYRYREGFSDVSESTCTLINGTFSTDNVGRIWGGIVGSFSCTVVTMRDGKPFGVAAAPAGPLSLGQEKDTGDWILTFMTGPSAMIYRLK